MPIGGRKGFSDKKPTKPKVPKSPYSDVRNITDYYAQSGAGQRVKPPILPVPDVSAVRASIVPAANTLGSAYQQSSAGMADPSGTLDKGFQTYDQLNPGADSTGGFADRYTPAANMAGFYQHPDVFAADYLGAQGITNPEMIDQFTNLTDLAYALQLVMQGSPGGADQTNFIADLLQQYSTPGGSIPDFDTLVNMLLNPDSGNTMSAAYAAQADPQSMNNLLLSLLQATTGNQYYTNAMKGQLDQTQRGFYSDQFQGAQGAAAGTYADMLRKQGLFG